MLSHNNNFPARGFLTPPPTWNHKACFPPAAPVSERKQPMANKDDFFRVLHKIPAGDSPYVRAKQVQLIDKDPSRAIPLFWGAINAGDRVDSALKDMAIVMKQLNRSNEAIEAIKSFRHLCPQDSQESLDNVLIELYKRSGRLDEQIEMIQHKLKAIDDGIAFEGKRTKTARSQGKKIEITIEQEKARLLGNLAWAHLQQGNHINAGELYKQALALDPDKNKECNLAICLMYMNKVKEAKSILHAVKVSSRKGRMDDSYARSFERAYQMLTELEANSFPNPNEQDDHEEKKRYLKSPVSRTSTQVNSCIKGERRQATRQQEETVFLDKPNRISHFQSQFENKNNFSRPEEESSRCRSLGLSSAESRQSLCADKWKRGAQVENPVERSDFSGRRNGNWVSSTEKVGSAQRRAYDSLLPVGENSKFPSTELRRGSCFLSKGDQRNSILGGNTTECPSHKLPVEYSIASEARQLAPQNLDGRIQASSSNEIMKTAFQRSGTSLASPGGPWGGITQVESEVMMESIPHSTLNRYGNWNSWGSDECTQLKNEEGMKSSSQPVANGKREGTYWGNVEQEKYQMKDSNQSPCIQMKSPIARAATPVTSNDVQSVTDCDKKRNFSENDKQKNFRTKESNLSPSRQLKSPASGSRAVAPASFNDGETIKFTLKESNLSPSMQLKSPASVSKAASPISFNDGETIKFMMKGSKSSPCMQLKSPTLDKAIARATFSDGESWEQGSDSQVMRDVKLTYSFGDKCFRRNSGKPRSENKKSWADMVEEEEQELLDGRTDFLESKLDCIYQKPSFSFRTPKKWSDCWSNGEDCNDENLNSNIFLRTPPSQHEIDNVSHKLEVFDMKDGYRTPGSYASSRNKPTVRRSLCFDQQQEAPCPSPLPRKGMNSEGCKFVPASECNSESSMRPKRRNRLQVFRDITLHTESSPRT